MSDSPYELQRLITIGTFSTPWEAQIAQARLAAEGVHSLIADEHVIRMVALSNAIGGIHLKVREQDAATAAAVLERLAPLPDIYLVSHDAGGPTAPPQLGEPEVRCPTCGGRDLQQERSSRLLLGVLPISRRGYRCADCGALWKPDQIAAGLRLGSPVSDTFGAGATSDLASASLSDPESDAEAGGEDTPLTTVARFHTPWEAHLARTLLESEGVRCCVLEERLPAVHLLSAEPTAFNRLEVRQADAARATEILDRAWSYPSLVAAPDPDPDPDPEEGPAGV